MATVTNITSSELKQQLSGPEGGSIFLLDVREDDEVAICCIENSKQIRLSELSSRHQELPQDKEIVVYCKLGGRSHKAAEYLLQHGFSKVKNLAGGIIGWAETVDPSMSKY